MLNQNSINGGLSQVISNSTSLNVPSKQKPNQNEVDEIFIIKLLKNYKENVNISNSHIFQSLRQQNPRLFNFVFHYFQTMLLKVYKYNKSQTEQQQKFIENLQKVTSFHRVTDQMQMNRQLQQLLGLWISYQNNQSNNSQKSKQDIIRQKELNYKQLLELTQDFLSDIIDGHQQIETLFLS